jgi:predicted GNAT family acetyltransferase
MASASDIGVVDVPEASRYEARHGDALLGFVEYRLLTGRITLIHTEVLPAAEGRGVGGRLARSVLDDARARGLRVRPLCPFITAWIQRHPEYADIVVEAPARQVGPPEREVDPPTRKVDPPAREVNPSA